MAVMLGRKAAAAAEAFSKQFGLTPKDNESL